ncbi:TFIIB-type zinc ribbon-containing protein [Gorillibacterium timonense]|uniref:TFIIB-type zinc ribbon-containing protein n=1 Tax=Gorillibacterium timonense TaxID=1689269 RepID=UPI00071D3083|nr:TFIIB-type zinc ribbon-containing protein [Gorillibacterium timonense]
MRVIEFKCPNCGSGMIFDSKSGTLACPGCGRTDQIETLPEPLEERAAAATERESDYHCTSCGGVIEADEVTTATVCSFCGAAVVLGDRLRGSLKPALVIPFRIGKEEAVAAFKKWCRNGRLTPAGFMTADRIKSISGVYVPFWLYDLDNRIEVQAHATKVRTYTRGDYQITETEHYEVYRKIRLDYERVPIDAAEKMSDKLMDRLEPYPYEQLKDFRSPYLAGFHADKYSYTDEELVPRVKEKIEPYIDSYIQSTVGGYTSVQFTSKQVNTAVQHAHYALLPVWVVQYDYDKLEHTFAMNGQTGKVVGKPPISAMKVAAWFGSIAGVSFLLLKTVSWMMGGGFW